MLVVLIFVAAGCEQGTLSKMLFTSIQSENNREVCVMNADGSNQLNLTNDPAVDEYPCWSPDGEKIAFVSNRDGNREIYIMDADGSNLKNLTNNPASDDMPSWLPDGEGIIFRSGRDGGGPCQYLYIMDADGANVARLPLCLAGDDAWTLSPDGREIAFSRWQEGARDIWVIDLETGEETNLTHRPTRDNGPIWSPDGTEIAFTSERDGPWEVYVMDADGNNLRKVTTYSGTVPTPEQRGQIPPGYLALAWFPDGEKLLVWLCEYDTNFDIVRWDLYNIDKDGKKHVNLTRGLPDIGAYPIGSCSPDGRKVVFSIWISNLPDSDLSEIWVVDADGSNLTKLTYNLGWDNDPTWQPR